MSLFHCNEWTEWFAWRPVITVSNQRVWWCKIYRKCASWSHQSPPAKHHYKYATTFDIMAFPQSPPMVTGPAPGHATVGQIWYDTVNNDVYVYQGAGVWTPIYP